MLDLRHGDCREVLRTIPDNSIDACVTDPPYELAFMGKHWDGTGIAYQVDLWAEVLRVLKPGGHLLAFGGTRTHHRMVCAIEDAGFEIRDEMQWIYGSGFPKSLDIGKAIDKAAGAEREVVGRHPNPATPRKGTFNASFGDAMITAPATPAAVQWDGWGTALKPAHEPICVARKPLCGTVAANVLRHGTGGINVDGCRVGTSAADAEAMARCNTPGSGRFVKQSPMGAADERQDRPNRAGSLDTTKGRWPANVLLTHAPGCDGQCVDGCPVKLMDEQSGERPGSGGDGGGVRPGGFVNIGAAKGGRIPCAPGYADTGGASRFFYCAKASRKERNAGLDGLPEKQWFAFQTCNGTSGKPSSLAEGRNTLTRNHHPTVKPVKLMRYLVRLVTPPGGVVLDPFLGSGTTGVAARAEGFRFLGIEQSAEYLEIAKRRTAGEGLFAEAANA